MIYEVFDKILAIKINNFEEFFIKKIKDKRNDELIILNKLEKIKFFIYSFFSSTGIFLSLISINSYIFFNNNLDVSSILTSLYIFNQLGEPLFLLPEYVMGFLNSLDSLKKVEEFLQNSDENNEISNENEEKNDFAIKINNVDFGIKFKFNNEDDENESDENDKSEFDNFSNSELESKSESNNLLNIKKVSSKSSNVIIDETTGMESLILLKNITLEIKIGELVAIIGEIGSGKTLLLNSILNNLDIIN